LCILNPEGLEALMVWFSLIWFDLVWFDFQDGEQDLPSLIEDNILLLLGSLFGG
jgi:hypothetical protein